MENRRYPRVSSFEFRQFLVVGCGNQLAGDDSVGVEVVRRLEKRGDPALREQLRTVRSAGVELLETFRGAEVVLFIDAVSSGAPPCGLEPDTGGRGLQPPTGGGPPGTLYLVPLFRGTGSEPVKAAIEPRALGTLSSHGWGLRETLELARSLGRRVPRLMLLGVEVEGVSLGASRSPAVEQAITLFIEQFPHLQSLLLDPASPLWRGPHRILPPGGAGMPHAGMPAV
jgi:Ni,Fe-hydrogenase maturation factor